MTDQAGAIEPVERLSTVERRAMARVTIERNRRPRKRGQGIVADVIAVRMRQNGGGDAIEV